MSEEIEQCCKTSKKFWLLLGIVFTFVGLTTFAYQGYQDDVFKIVSILFISCCFAGIMFFSYITVLMYAKYCGILGQEKIDFNTHIDFRDLRAGYVFGMVGFPVILAVIFNHVAVNIDWIVRIYS